MRPTQQLLRATVRAYPSNLSRARALLRTWLQHREGFSRALETALWGTLLCAGGTASQNIGFLAHPSQPHRVVGDPPVPRLDCYLQPRHCGHHFWFSTGRGCSASASTEAKALSRGPKTARCRCFWPLSSCPGCVRTGTCECVCVIARLCIRLPSPSLSACAHYT